MIKAIEFPGKTFATQDDLFAALKDSKAELTALKTSEIKSSDPVALGILTTKNGHQVKGMRMEKDSIYPVINTTRIMDYHNDVHLDGIWNKSIKDQQEKVFYLTDHDMRITSVIAYQKDVEPMVKSFTFTELGAPEFEGSTQGLVFKVARDKIRIAAVNDVINEDIPVEHSVRMQYVSLELAVNSESENLVEEKEVWDKYYSVIANKDRADSIGYFWAVKEAKIYKEGSMVLAGSNSVTPLLQRKTEPPVGTQHKGAGSATSAKQFFINLTK